MRTHQDLHKNQAAQPANQPAPNLFMSHPCIVQHSDENKSKEQGLGNSSEKMGLPQFSNFASVPVQSQLTSKRSSDEFKQEADYLTQQAVHSILTPETALALESSPIQRQDLPKTDQWMMKQGPHQHREDRDAMLKPQLAIDDSHSNGNSLADQLQTPIEQFAGSNFCTVRVLNPIQKKSNLLSHIQKISPVCKETQSLNP
ncbi:MAG: hypothetical protein HC790_08245 [Acaryochloridaceae cyanobacterium CSU_3_4]|nr:hypothetical protein [Acaryochloridaceae cyanobacterium CSU_3_4]